MIIVYSRRANRYRNLGDKERPIGSNLTFGAPFDGGYDFVGHLVQQKGRGEIYPHRARSYMSVSGDVARVRAHRCAVVILVPYCEHDEPPQDAAHQPRHRSTYTLPGVEAEPGSSD